MHEQLDRLSHVAMAGLVHEPAALLAARLAEVSPGELNRTFFSDDGSTSVEVAIRAAFQFHLQNGAPERTLFVSLQHAYHGDTIGTASLGGVETFHGILGPLLFETIRVPSPAEHSTPDWHESSFAELEARVRAQADKIAAVVVEPLVQGAAGMLMYPPEVLRRLRRLCDEVGTFLIADEVFVGMGRTGKLFACEHAGITPDFMCLSKGLTGGFLPFAATLTTERVYDGFRGDAARTFWYGHSYCANPLGCAAALAVLDTFEEDGVLDGVAERASEMQSWLDRFEALPYVTDVRRTGLIGAVQYGPTAKYLQRAGWSVAKEAEARGAYLRPLGNVLYFCPALTATRDELDSLLGIGYEATRAAFETAS